MKKSNLKIDKKSTLLIFLGSILWSITMIKSGIAYKFGYGFWGPNGHDGIWHIALSNSISKGTLENPVFSGNVLKNYHLGFDILLALVHRITTVKTSFLYFQVFPLLMAFLIGFLTYQFVLRWRKSKGEAFWSVVFTYFATSFGFIITFFKDKVISGESVFWSQQSFSTLVNPPYSLSLIFILSGLIFLNKYKKKASIKNFLLTVLFFGPLIQVKAYAAILVLGSLACLSLYEVFLYRKYESLKIFVGSTTLNLILFFSFKSDAVSVFNFQPFWFLETMMSYTDRVGWERYFSAMTNYRMGGVWVKALFAYVVAFVIFLVGNIGTRLFGLGYLVNLIKRKEKIDSMTIFIFSLMGAAILIPLLFVQKGTPWNTIQFFYYFLFFFGIFAGISVSKMFKSANAVRRKIIIFVSLLLALLGSWVTLQHYLPLTPPAKISTEEVEALSFLKNQDPGVVLTYPYDPVKAKEKGGDAPRPLYFYDSTAYVSAYSEKQIFLEDEVNLNIMGYPFKERREDVLGFISNLDPEKGKSFLKENNIGYLYLVKENSPLFGEYLRLGEDDLGMEKIFENQVVVMYNASK